MKRGNIMTAAGAALAMAVLILDTKTALAGGTAGVQLCIHVLIPSLFPFFLCSNLLTANLAGRNIPLLRPLGRLLRIPAGSESIVLVGLLGGYPVGAQAVAQAKDSGALSGQDARRMLAFCSNAGPAFLFGMGAQAFPEIWVCWALWLIHIISALLVGALTPGGSEERACIRHTNSMTVPDALKRSVLTMGLICGWVMIFRILLGFLQRWFLWLFPETVQIVLSGFLEIANGCCSLTQIGNTGLRLQLFGVFLGFGGLCVALQTKSVAGSVETALYLPGKLAQTAISLLLCVPMQLVLLREQRYYSSPILYGICGLILVWFGFFTRKIQNNSSNRAALVV